MAWLHYIPQCSWSVLCMLHRAPYWIFLYVLMCSSLAPGPNWPCLFAVCLSWLTYDDNPYNLYGISCMKCCIAAANYWHIVLATPCLVIGVWMTSNTGSNDPCLHLYSNNRRQHITILQVFYKYNYVAFFHLVATTDNYRLFFWLYVTALQPFRL